MSPCGISDQETFVNANSADKKKKKSTVDSQNSPNVMSAVQFVQISS